MVSSSTGSAVGILAFIGSENDVTMPSLILIAQRMSGPTQGAIT
ncbi:hypothetical protein [Brachybacterium sp. UNK5269]